MLFPYRDINPTSSPPIVTVTLIVVNFVVFVYLWLASDFDGTRYHAYLAQLGLIPSNFFSPKVLSITGPVPIALTPISAMFLHGGFFHIAGNMLYLWIFGNNVEDYLGHARFIFFYFLVGIVASLAFMITAPSSKIPMIGASGAVAGVMGAYIILWPRARIKTLLVLIIFFTIVELPAVAVLGYWILIQVLQGSASLGQKTGVAWFAHIGGFFAGLALILLYIRKRPRPSARRRLRIVRS